MVPPSPRIRKEVLELVKMRVDRFQLRENSSRTGKHPAKIKPKSMKTLHELGNAESFKCFAILRCPLACNRFLCSSVLACFSAFGFITYAFLSFRSVLPARIPVTFHFSERLEHKMLRTFCCQRRTDLSSFRAAATSVEAPWCRSESSFLRYFAKIYVIHV